jgi:hypothetical protein
MVVLIFVLLMVTESECFSTSLLAICVFSVGKCLLKTFVYLSNWLVFLVVSYISPCFYMNLSYTWFINTSSQSISYLYLFLSFLLSFFLSFFISFFSFVAVVLATVCGLGGCFLDRVPLLCSSGCSRMHYINQADLKFKLTEIHLPLPPK